MRDQSIDPARPERGRGSGGSHYTYTTRTPDQIKFFPMPMDIPKELLYNHWMNELHLTKADFRIEWYSGQGAGGQHRNKHQNCCRIIHIESGLKAQGADSRERPANQRDAFNRLAKLVINYYIPEAVKIRVRSTKVIRNYHAVRNEVHDKASGLKLPYKVVINDLSPMIEARKKAVGGHA